MSEQYIPNPDRNPFSIQILTDDDDQRAMSFNPGAQDLGDKCAYIEKRTLGRVGTVAQMQALADVVEGDRFEVIGQGGYYYLPTLAYFQTTWAYEATGMGVGGWRHELAGPLFGGQNPARLLESLLPTAKIESFSQHSCAAPIAFAVGAVTEWLQVRDTEGNALTTSVGDIAANDVLSGTAGPFLVTVPMGVTSGGISLRVRVSQGGLDVFVGPIDVDAIGIVNPAGGYFSGNWHAHVVMPFHALLSVANVNAVVVLEALGGSAGTPAVISSSQWGEYGKPQWLRMSRLRS